MKISKSMAQSESKHGGRGSHTERIGAVQDLTGPHLAVPVRGRMIYRNNETKEHWLCVAQTSHRVNLRRGNEYHWTTRTVLHRDYTLVARSAHIECSCLSCRCPHVVSAEGSVCHKCKVNTHDGRPNVRGGKR